MTQMSCCFNGWAYGDADNHCTTLKHVLNKTDRRVKTRWETIAFSRLSSKPSPYNVRIDITGCGGCGQCSYGLISEFKAHGFNITFAHVAFLGIHYRGVQSEGVQWIGAVLYNKTAYNIL